MNIRKSAWVAAITALLGSAGSHAAQEPGSLPLQELRSFADVFNQIRVGYVEEIDGIPCETYIDWFAITFALTMTSCPVVTVPCGFTAAGLPVGIQIVVLVNRKSDNA